MNSIYHIKPEPMVGTQLIPLNQMDLSSDLYSRAKGKYIGREQLMSARIPILDCLWNDVLHFSSIDPRLLVQELLKIDPGFPTLKRTVLKFTADHFRHQASKMILLDTAQWDLETNFISEERISNFCSSSYRELSHVPVDTIETWRQSKASGGKYLLFHGVPHVLLKGSIDISGAEEITIPGL